ncbi:glycosyltransferase [Bordetella genomosp. 4]|uniref:glycosyltransferase n=1 Tax=Bordetella genomosp. 4 TaxID=463044 RepID=UPI000B9E9495|nr:glycosyltransferase [Bordetella genomosp. 4]OZI48366.1 hypothetical protein CAL21_10900 [Bordetella genomosp. 4]
MNKHVFVMIRYSVLSKNRGNSWIVGRKDFNDYREELFGSERLAARLDLFKKITLPSLVNQTKAPSKDWLSVYVLVSEDMPKESLGDLQKLVSPYSWITVVPVPVEDTKLNAPLVKALSEAKEELCYATVRLDDDDALARTYFEGLYQYLEPKFAGFCVSYGKGVAGIIENGKFVEFKSYYYPKIALGLAYLQHKPANARPVNKSVYDTGNHTRIDQRYPIILDSRFYAFFRTVHKHADTADKTLVNVSKFPSLDFSEVSQQFCIDSDLFV